MTIHARPRWPFFAILLGSAILGNLALVPIDPFGRASRAEVQWVGASFALLALVLFIGMLFVRLRLDEQGLEIVGQWGRVSVRLAWSEVATWREIQGAWIESQSEDGSSHLWLDSQSRRLEIELHDGQRVRVPGDRQLNYAGGLTAISAGMRHYVGDKELPRLVHSAETRPR